MNEHVAAKIVGTRSGGRRRFLKRLAGMGFILAGFSADTTRGSEADEGGFKALKEGDKFFIGDRGGEIIKNAYRIGRKYEDEHKGCARCTVATLQEAIGFVSEDKGLFRAASCLGGGATKSEGNCGSFTGSVMVIGWLCGTHNFGDSGELSSKLVGQVYDRYKEEYGSVLCKDLKKKMDGDCPEIVGRAASWTAEILLTQFTDYKQSG